MNLPFILPVILFMGLVPMVVWTAFLWWIDYWEREPRYLIALGFLWGAVPAILLVGVVQYFVLSNLFSASIFFNRDPYASYMLFVIVGPSIEESVKALALLTLFLFRRREIDSLLDGLIYGSAVGFGFAAVENISYFIDASYDPEFSSLGVIILLRTFVFGTNHAIFTGISGLGFAMTRFQKSRAARLGFPLLGLLLAVMLHGLHNFLAMSGPTGGLFWAIAMHAIAVLGVVALITTSLIIQRRWVRQYLKDEVQNRVLTQAQADVASSYFKSRKLRGNSRRINQLSIKLAIKKHTCARVGGKAKSMREIEKLRRQVADLSGSV